MSVRSALDENREGEPIGPCENSPMGAETPAGQATESQSDDQLVAAARLGDSAALEMLLVRYQPHLYRFGVRMCGNPEDASDVAQESLISMARSVRDFRGDASVSSWLYTIARRFCIKKRRRSKFAPAREESLDAPGAKVGQYLADPGPNPEQTAVNSELATALTHAIDALEPSQREVLVLRDVEGLSAPEVAGILGVSVDAVKSRLHRARAVVRQEVASALGRPAIAPSRGARCPDILPLFSRHLEGDIDPDTCAKMEAHLTTCDRCRDACDSLKRTLAICRRLPTPKVPPSLAASVQAAIKAFLDNANKH